MRYWQHRCRWTGIDSFSRRDGPRTASQNDALGVSQFAGTETFANRAGGARLTEPWSCQTLVLMCRFGRETSGSVGWSEDLELSRCEYW